MIKYLYNSIILPSASFIYKNLENKFIKEVYIMENSMAKGMAERYEDYLHTAKLEKRVAKSIYYWVMSTLEFLFWTFGRKAQMALNFLQAKKKCFWCFVIKTEKNMKLLIFQPKIVVTRSCQ